MMMRVLVTRSGIPLVRERLSGLSGVDLRVWDREDRNMPREDLLKEVSGCHGVLCLLGDKINKEVLDACGPQLKVVSTMSVGFDNVDVTACTERSVAVGNTPGVLDRTTAETAVALLFATSRRVIECSDSVKSGEWGVWRPLQYCGTDVSGKTIGIVGLGRIAEAFCRMMAGFGCKILYCGPRPKPEVASSIGATYCSFEHLLEQSDIVSVHCPLNEATTRLFDAAAFARMRPSALLINTSRGGVVDQDALYDALAANRIGGAGLDVTDPEPLPPSHKLLTLPNCTVLPHIGSATVATRTQMADRAIQNLMAGLEGEPLPFPVVRPVA